MLTIAIDFSQHMGIAWHDTTQRKMVRVKCIHGTPIYQLDAINKIIGKKRKVQIVYESLNSMRNKRVVESLLGGLGYIRWSLRAKRIPFYSYGVPLIRGSLKVPGKVSDKKNIMLNTLKRYTKKPVSDNHSDALAVLFMHLHGPKYNTFDYYLSKYTLNILSDSTQPKKEWVAPYN